MCVASHNDFAQSCEMAFTVESFSTNHECALHIMTHLLEKI